MHRKAFCGQRAGGRLRLPLMYLATPLGYFERLHGEALLIYGDSKPVAVGQIMKIGSGGNESPLFLRPQAMLGSQWAG